MSTKIALLSIFVSIGASASPTFAQQQISSNQPVTRVSTEVETRIQAKLKLDFKQGLINSTQLAGMQRDFDGILAREDDFKSRGETSGGSKEIGESLANFERRLDKAAGVTTTQDERMANGPKVDKNNANLSDVAPTK